MHKKISFLFTKKKVISHTVSCNRTSRLFSQNHKCQNPACAKDLPNFLLLTFIIEAQPKHFIFDTSVHTTLCRHITEKLTKMREMLLPALTELTV